MDLTSAGHQQPLSLMTINASPNTDDLLIIRVLESSERKMQLIKKLLTPEEYNSVASELFSQDFSRAEQPISCPVSVQLSDPIEDKLAAFEPCGRSHGCSCHSKLRGAHLHENLTRKREAIEFFFDEKGPSSLAGGLVDKGLSIELRAGRYLGSNPSADNVVKSSEFRLQDCAPVLTDLLGISRLSEDSPMDADAQRFLEIHRSLNRSAYSRTQNLLVMKDRLQADGQLDKVLANADEFTYVAEPAARVPISHTVSSFNNSHSMGPVEFMQENASVFMKHNPMVDLILEKASRVLDLIREAFRLKPPPAAEQETRQVVSEPPQLVDMLYGKIFNDREPALRSPDWKISRLINRVDFGFLVELLLGRKLEGFYLDPFIDLFGQENRPEQDEADSDRLREALLVWRWANNQNQPVYLSRQENIKAYSLQLDEIKSKVMQMIADKPESGYRLIEQRRKRAVEYLRQFEAELEELLALNRERASSRQQRASGNRLATSLLVEPKLGRLHFSGAARVALRLVPRRTARRPLKPRIRRGTLSGRLASGLVPHLDLETGSSDAELARHRLARTNPAQLVISIRHAANVPMRVVHHQQVGPSSLADTRTGSPFMASPLFSPSTPRADVASPISFMQPFGNQLIAQQPSYLLAAPTTYVEMVFQRKQQASSLSQGKNPAWNETFFFPVETPSDEVPSGQQQLVDEHLQLNLYDYHAYTVASDEPTPSEQTTLVLGSFRSANELSSAASSPPEAESALGLSNRQPPSRTLTSRQRIERNLLGSLRVPLSTLLSSARIEGSFAFNQPLFLNDYQYEPEPATGVATNPLAANQEPSGEHQHAQTYLSLFITLDPPVALPLQLHLATGSSENERLFEYAQLWEKVMLLVSGYCSKAALRTSGKPGGRRFGIQLKKPELELYEPRRHIRALVLRSDAKYCLVCRLLVPLEPPPQLQVADLERQMRILARFVSLLSPLKHGLLAMRSLAASLYFDSAQLLNQSLGGPEEKAVLLCNYFLQLGKCSGLLFADSVEDGRCVYVIVWEDQTGWLPGGVDEQLQLEAASLMLRAGQLESGQQQSGGRRPPVTGASLLARLPILVSAKSIKLWNPISGKEFSLSDHLALASVGSIATMENVYANVQSTNKPSDINYDIRLKNLWVPLFESSPAGASLSRNIAFGRGSVGLRSQISQLEAMRGSLVRPPMAAAVPMAPIDYGQLSADQCIELREAVERAIKASLLKCRPQRPTYFNRTLSRLLADKLASFEEKSQLAADARGFDWRNELSELVRSETLVAQHLSSSRLNTRQAISWPANLSYTSMKTILDSLFASGVYNADLSLGADQPGRSGRQASSTQFVVACHVHPYPSSTVSLWLYVAAVLARERA